MNQKIALITGANKGLGLETARQLAQGHNMKVLIGARDAGRGEAAAQQLQSEKLDATFIQLDVSDENSIAQAVKKVEAEFGVLDVLINNAGVMIEHDARVSNLSLADWRASFEVNLFGAVAVTSAFLPLLQKSEAARIVNLSSILASLSEMSKPAMGAWIRASYTSSKAALNGYTVALASELRDSKIKINAAHPGWAKTDMGGKDAPMTAVQGAKTGVQLATLPDDGPTGGFFHMGKSVNW